MPFEVKNMRPNPLSVGKFHFETGETKIIDNADEEVFAHALKKGYVKSLQPRMESDDMAKDTPKEKPKEAPKEKKDEKQPERQPRVESDEIQADSPEMKKGLFGFGKKA